MHNLMISPTSALIIVLTSQLLLAMVYVLGAVIDSRENQLRADLGVVPFEITTRQILRWWITCTLVLIPAFYALHVIAHMILGVI